jgi:hypothetical protein
MFWVSPLQYAFTSLANNELPGGSYKTIAYDGVVRKAGAIVPLGESVLDLYGVLHGEQWRRAA